MTGLCGWYAASPLADANDRLQRMRGDAPTGRCCVLPGGVGGFSAAAGVPPAQVVEIQGGALAAVGHPRLTAAGRRDPSLEAIAAHLALHGEDGLRDIGGDFAIAFWNTASRRGFIAVDRIGVQPLFHADVGGALVFGSTLDAVVRHPGVDSALSLQSVFDYLYFHVCPGPGTLYRGVRRLDAGHLIAFGDRGASAPRAYWAMDFREDRRVPLPVLKEQFIGVLQDAVRDLGTGTEAGSFLSGGTDSSTVTGMLGRVSGRPARAFSIGFDVAGYDEMAYARTAARHFGSEHHEYYVTPADVVDALPRIAGFYDQPFGNASAIPVYYCAQQARQRGITRLLAGDGGDELFGGNARYAKQHVLGLYQRVPAALRHGLIEPLTTQVPLFGLPGLRKLRSYVQQASPPMPARYESYNLLNHLGADTVLEPDFLAAVDRGHPLALMGDAYAPFADRSLINQLLGIDLRFTLADSDLPKVTRMCSLAGIDVAFPLLDERVVEFSATLEPWLKLRGTQLRWFFKDALKDFLPPEVITKRKQGFGLPVGDWLVAHRPLNALACEAIDALAPHRIVRPAFVDDLMQRRLQQHPPYYGTMVWILTMLGLWLQSRRP